MLLCGRVFTHGAMGHWINPSAISCSSQCSTTGATKAMVCYLVYRMIHINGPWLIIGKRSPCTGGCGFPFSLSEWFFTICPTPYNQK